MDQENVRQSRLGTHLVKKRTHPRPPLRLIDCQKQRDAKMQRDTVLVLQALLARAMRDEVSDMALCFVEDGRERWILRGAFKDVPEKAFHSALRLAWSLTEPQ